MTTLKQSAEYDAETIYRTKVLDLILVGQITQIQAARELELKSNRQIRNLLNKYQQGGCTIKSLQRKRKGLPWNKLSSLIRGKNLFIVFLS